MSNWVSELSSPVSILEHFFCAFLSLLLHSFVGGPVGFGSDFTDVKDIAVRGVLLLPLENFYIFL